MSSVNDRYRSKVLYKHPSSVEARGSAKPAAANSELGAARRRHQHETSEFAQKARKRRDDLDNRQKKESSRAPHASFDQKHTLQRRDLDKELKTEGEALRNRHDAELKAIKEKKL
jgi:hypothetical protein